MKKLKLVGLLLCLSVSSFALNITIIESTSYNAGHVMDGVWSGVATSMGHTPTIMPQTTLDNNAFFPTTDILIISSGVINIPANRVATILQFLQTGKPVYIETEYLSSFDANITFASLVSSLGGTFNWTGTVAGTLAPMNVLGTFATTTNNVPSISYFWYGDAGIGDCNTIPFLEFGGQNFGWQYVPTNPAWGNIITTCDQDWVNQSTSLPLMQNIITHLINPGFIPGPSGNVNLGNDTTICSGNQLVLNATSANSTYLWQNNSTNPTFTVTTTGTYYVAVTGTCGVSHDTINVTIGLLNATQTQNNVTCNGGTNGSATVTATGGGPYTYSWAPSGGNGPTASNLAAGTYTVTITNPSCSITQTVTITQPTPITLATSSTPASCGSNNGTATVNANGGSGVFTYAWAPSGGNAATANNLTAGIYTVTVTDANSCASTATVTVSSNSTISATVSPMQNVTCYGGTDGSATVNPTGGTAPYSYSWSPVGGTNASASNLSAGTYSVSITDALLCTSIVILTITEPQAIVLTTSGNVTICSGNSTTLQASATGGTGAYTFVWNPGPILSNSAVVTPNTTTTYTSVVTDANGCIISSPVTVTVSQPATVLAAGSTQICAGQSATLTANANNGGPYTWQPGNLSGSSVTVSPATTTTYTVSVIDQCTNLPVTDTVTISVESITPQFLQAPPNGCVPWTVQYTDQSTTTSGNITSWSWDFGDGNTSTQQNPSHLYIVPGTYTVTLTVTNSSGCTITYTNPTPVNIYPLPTAAFSITNLPVTALEPDASFADNSLSAVTWQWDFGDGGTSTLQNPTHVFAADTGTYPVTLIVSNSYGCTDTAYGELTVFDDFTFYIPNAFTPNGNGLNEFFGGVGNGISKYHMMIFDRWGMLLYDTTDINKPWDGTFKGNKVEEDVYVYKISVTDIFYTLHTYVGHVTLVR